VTWGNRYDREERTQLACLRGHNAPRRLMAYQWPAPFPVPPVVPSSDTGHSFHSSWRCICPIIDNAELSSITDLTKPALNL